MMCDPKREQPIRLAGPQEERERRPRKKRAGDIPFFSSARDSFGAAFRRHHAMTRTHLRHKVVYEAFCADADEFA